MHRGGVPDLPVVTARDRSDGGGRRWAWIGISGLLVVALVVAAGWIAFNVLPTAAITVVPRTQAAQPVDLTVIADPTATAVDTTRGVVPAQVVTIPLTATDTFNATGTKPVDSAASGTVTFISYDTGRSRSRSRRHAGVDREWRRLRDDAGHRPSLRARVVPTGDGILVGVAEAYQP